MHQQSQLLVGREAEGYLSPWVQDSPKHMHKPPSQKQKPKEKRHKIESYFYVEKSGRCHFEQVN